MIVPFLLIWGSFLNMLSYRLITGDSLCIRRSFCPSCKKSLAWYDLIPVISWISLSGRCRYCTKKISWLYPFIELLTVLAGSLLITYTPQAYWIGYAIFISALIITIRTDLEHMLISRFASLYLIPVGYLLAYFGLIPIDLSASIIGSITAYGILYTIGYLYYKITHKLGLGLGDVELLAMIGAFTGIIGWWASLVIGSFAGSILGIILLFITKNRKLKIPFGPFLALGALIYIFFGYQLEVLLRYI